MASAGNTVLPVLIVSPSDIRRLRRELESIEDFLRQASLRQGGKSVKVPVTSRLLDSVVAANELNLLHKTDRDRLTKYLALLLERAPVVHISFASDPSAIFVGKLVEWLRANIHPQLLVRIGLQPSIAAGCVVRTANKEFDFSLKHAFEERKSSLIEVLKRGATT